MKRLLAVILFLCLSVSFAALFYTTPPKSFAQSVPYVQDYLGGDADESGKLSGKDAALLLQAPAGWDIPLSEKVGSLREGKYVRLFYFLWMGPVGTFHFWGELLF